MYVLLLGIVAIVDALSWSVCLNLYDMCNPWFSPVKITNKKILERPCGLPVWHVPVNT